ncbi:tripartite tricarboxylate transporter substrate binding protein [Pseudolabrys sp. FHR47]|uniref:Bug family tripartite tricarboxylate transporter substrate binding protein n=1 Tax=Pseudolabrys sp. FHR47 TaxID=2562284 RepID=UPI00197F7B6C|nr:tripartite tricarboxylate transporter substrate-binding protein [Pseudolabrys sp. FHR47]
MQATSPARLTRRAALTLLASAAMAPRTAFAAGVPAGFPKSQITLVAPFTAGGPIDVLARLLAQEFQARSGVTAIVENKTGGAGNIGIDYVRKAPPDGATLLVIPAGNLTINPTLMPSAHLDILGDFAPVALLASAPNVFLASKQSGIATVKELVDKAKTAKLTYGSPGVGSQLHLAMELFKEKTGATNLTHVPYRGSSQALADLLGGHIDLLSTNLPAVLGNIKEKTVVPLAMTTAQRSPLVPEVPTLVEAGVEGIDVTSWYGMLVPKAVPTETVDAIFTVTKDALSEPAMKNKLQSQGLSVAIEPPDVFAARIARETAQWADIIKKRDIKIQ